jgi:hypothetical protein
MEKLFYCLQNRLGDQGQIQEGNTAFDMVLTGTSHKKSLNTSNIAGFYLFIPKRERLFEDTKYMTRKNRSREMLSRLALLLVGKLKVKCGLSVRGTKLVHVKTDGHKCSCDTCTHG